MDGSLPHLQYELDDDDERRREKLLHALKSFSGYWSARRAVKEAALSLPLTTLADELPRLLSSSSVSWRLRNLIYLADRNASERLNDVSAGDSTAHEPLEMVEAARKQWDARLRHQLRAIATEHQRSLAERRRRHEDGDALSLPTRLVYSWRELLEALEAQVNPNASCTFSRVCGWGVIKLSLRTPSIDELRRRYNSLRPDVRQVGLDDQLSGLEWFREQSMAEGKRLLQGTTGTIQALRHFAQTGVPASLRPRVWRRILGITSSDHDMAYYEQLINHVRRWDLVTDDLYRLEVQDTSDHSAYFVFEDMLDEMMLAFSRDSWLPRNCPLVLNTAPLLVSLQSEASAAASSSEGQKPNGGPGRKQDKHVSMSVPPCQVVPFSKQVMLAAPLCYMFAEADDAYFMFREMYARYFCRLHIISSRPNTIMYLSKMFEDLVQQCHPQAFYHATEVGVTPLTIVFPWLLTAFSGFLAVDQVLVLWDRILAYDSLELLAVLAAAIFLYRSSSMMSASSVDEIQDIFEDGAYFRVLPLLQHFLFA